MSQKELCASCTSFSVDSPMLSSSSKKPKWLDENDFVEDFIESQKVFKERKQRNCDQTIEINLGKKAANRYVLYWAAMSCDKLAVQGARKAYSQFKNNGIVKLNRNGCGKLHLQCPQIYKTVKKGSTKEESFYRHFHFVIGNKDNTTWLSQLYSHIIVCKRNKRDTMHLLKDKSTVVLNALPAEYYAKDHIPNTFNVTATQVKTMSKQKWHSWLKEVVDLHYPMLSRMLKNKTLEIDEVPVLTYCANKECNASSLLANELLKKGQYRVDEFPGGIKEFRD
jgi:hypothetical protein